MSSCLIGAWLVLVGNVPATPMGSWLGTAPAQEPAEPPPADSPPALPPSAAPSVPAVMPPLEWSPPPAPESALARLNQRWYGWQLVLTDVASLGLAAGSSHQTLAAVGFATVPPALHVLDGDWKVGLASALWRSALVLGLRHFGFVWTSHQSADPCGPIRSEVCLDNLREPAADQGAAILFLAGLLFVFADDTLLSLREAPSATAQPPRPARSFAFTPTMSASADGVAMGLAGMF